MTPFRVGLTGGIAAGKSTVAAWLRESGFTVIDADRLVADLYRPGGDGAAVVSQLFGSSFLTAAGEVDHQRLASRIFRDATARRQLESAIHPLVKREFEALANRTDEIVVLEAPLLVEAGLATDFDLVITVESTPEMRIRRAVARGLSPDEAHARLTAQTDEATRTAAAHKVLRNDGSLDELHRQVETLVEEIRRRAEDAR